jgi:hypothetical protein
MISIVDYRKRRVEHAPIHMDGVVVGRVESFKFLGVHITNKLSWSKVVNKARQHIFSLRRLESFGMGLQILKMHYQDNPDPLHHRLVWQQHEQQLGSVYGPVHHWCQASCHLGPIY